MNQITELFREIMAMPSEFLSQSDIDPLELAVTVAVAALIVAAAVMVLFL